MQACLSLRTARLVDNEIAGLEPLRYLIELRGLTLDENAVSDLEPLAGLLGLQNIDFLVNLRQLRNLNLEFNRIQSLEALHYHDMIVST